MANIQTAKNFSPSTLSTLFTSLRVLLLAGSQINLDYNFEDTPKISFTLVGVTDLENTLNNYRGLAQFDFLGETYYMVNGTSHAIDLSTSDRIYVTNISGEHINSYLLDLPVKTWDDIPQRSDRRLYNIQNPLGDRNKILLQKLKQYCDIDFDNAGSPEAEPFYPPVQRLNFLQALRQKSLINGEYVDLTSSIISTRKLNQSSVFIYSSYDLSPAQITIQYNVNKDTSALINDTLIVPNEGTKNQVLLNIDYSKQPYVKTPLLFTGNIGDNLQENLDPDLISSRLPDSLLIRPARLELRKLSGNYKRALPRSESFSRSNYLKKNPNKDIPDIEVDICIKNIEYDQRIDLYLMNTPSSIISLICNSDTDLEEEQYVDVAYPAPTCFEFGTGRYPNSGERIPYPEFAPGNPTVYEGGPTSDRTVECVLGDGSPDTITFENFGFIHGDVIINGQSVFGEFVIPYRGLETLVTINDVNPNITDPDDPQSFERYQGINKWAQVEKRVTNYKYIDIPFPGIKSATGKPGKYLAYKQTEGIKKANAVKAQVKSAEKDDVFSLIRDYNALIQKYANVRYIVDLKDRCNYIRSMIRDAATVNGQSDNVLFTLLNANFDNPEVLAQTPEIIQNIQQFFNISELRSQTIIADDLSFPALPGTGTFPITGPNLSVWLQGEGASDLNVLTGILDAIMRTLFRKIIKLAYTQYQNFDLNVLEVTEYQIKSSEQLYNENYAALIRSEENTKIRDQLMIDINQRLVELRSLVFSFKTKKQKVDDFLITSNDRKQSLLAAYTSEENNRKDQNIWQNNLIEYNQSLDLYIFASNQVNSLLDQRNNFYQNLFSEQSALIANQNQLVQKQQEKNSLLILKALNLLRISDLQNFTLVLLNYRKDELTLKLSEVNDVSVAGIQHPYTDSQLNSQISAVNVQIANVNTQISNLNTININIDTVDIPQVDLEIINIQNDISVNNANIANILTDVDNVSADINLFRDQAQANINRPLINVNINTLIPTNLYSFIDNFDSVNVVGYPANVNPVKYFFIPDLDSIPLIVCQNNQDPIFDNCRDECDFENDLGDIENRVRLNTEIDSYIQDFILSDAANQNLQTSLIALNTTIGRLANLDISIFQVLTLNQQVENLRNQISNEITFRSNLQVQYDEFINYYEFYLDRYQNLTGDIIQGYSSISNDLISEIDFYQDKQVDPSTNPTQSAKYQEFIDRRDSKLTSIIGLVAPIVLESDSSFNQANNFSILATPILPQIQAKDILIFNLEGEVTNTGILLSDAQQNLDYAISVSDQYYNEYNTYWTTYFDYVSTFYDLRTSYFSMLASIENYYYDFLGSTIRCYERALQEMGSDIEQLLNEITDLYKQYDQARIGQLNDPFYIVKEITNEQNFNLEYRYDKQFALFQNGEQVEFENLDLAVYKRRRSSTLPTNDRIIKHSIEPLWDDTTIIWKTVPDEKIIVKSYILSGKYTIEITTTLERRPNASRQSTSARAYIGTPPAITPIFPTKAEKKPVEDNVDDLDQTKEREETQKQVEALKAELEELKNERAFNAEQFQKELDVLIKNNQLRLRELQRLLERTNFDNINVPGESLKLDNLNNSVEERRVNLINLQRLKDKAEKLDICQSLKIRDNTKKGTTEYPFAYTRDELVNAYSSDMTKQSYNSVLFNFEIPQNLDIKPGCTIILDNLSLIVLRASHTWDVTSGGGFILKTSLTCGLNRGVGSIKGFYNIPLDQNLYSILDIIDV